MGIHFVCHHCSFALHVKDFQAGKRGKCPSCNNSFRIPTEDASYSSELEEETENPAVSKVKQAFQAFNQINAPKLASDSSNSISIAIEPTPLASTSSSRAKQSARQLTEDQKVVKSQAMDTESGMPVALANALDAKWFVRPPSGGQFGPAPASLLISWVAESRVTADSLLCQEGQTQWQTASELLPEMFRTNREAMPAQQSVPTSDHDGTIMPGQSMTIDPTGVRSGAILKKKMQKRKQQLTMVILLATVSLVLFSILIFVLVFQVGKPTVAN